MGDRPPAEIEVDEPLVRRLLVDQHADLAHLPLVEVAAGWDNVIFRLGADLAVRLPRRALGAELVEAEHRWLPVLAPRLPLPVPAPVRLGRPGEGYPWAWTVTRWIPGRSAAETPPRDPERTARRLGAFVRAFHRPAPADAPRNPYRGVPLADRTELTLDRIDRLPDAGIRRRATALWLELAATPAWEGGNLWIHGDLHPGNLVVDEGDVVAVIDFGDLTSGDPASDLAVAWMVLPPASRPTFRRAAGGVDEATWCRARAWALSLAAAVLDASADDPLMARVGEATLAAALAG